MDWYETDVNDVIAERQRCKYQPETVFYGSSSIRLWSTLYDDFKPYRPVNLGFGGSTLAACTWFFDSIVAPVQNPKIFFLYAGDNDLSDGRHPEEVLLFFRQFMSKFRQRYPALPFYYISIKPSVSRSEIIDEIINCNQLIHNEIDALSSSDHFINIYNEMVGKNGKPNKSLFQADGLHLNSRGYAIWKQVILQSCFNTGSSKSLYST